MESVMSKVVEGNRLTSSLCRIAADPAQVGTLYEILGGYCHQCRNTLNSLKLSLYLARRGGAPDTSTIWDELEPRYQAVERLFDRLQMICRPMMLSPSRLPLALLIEEHRPKWDALLAEHGRRLELLPPRKPVVGDYDPYRLGQGLDALVALCAEQGESDAPIGLHWSSVGSQIQLEWDDSEISGSGASEHFDASDPFALPFLARIISAHGGTLDVSLDQGLRLLCRWPIDVRSHPR
jgi:hypothetical protein